MTNRKRNTWFSIFFFVVAISQIFPHRSYKGNHFKGCGKKKAAKLTLLLTYKFPFVLFTANGSDLLFCPGQEWLLNYFFKGFTGTI